MRVCYAAGSFSCHSLPTADGDSSGGMSCQAVTRCDNILVLLARPPLSRTHLRRRHLIMNLASNSVEKSVENVDHPGGDVYNWP